MFCSVIIPTIDRATLARAVASVLEQQFAAADFELVVVNDCGAPLAPAAWQQSPRVRLLATNRRERSVARNAGAATARGEWLCFLDDDDWLLPGALATIARLARTSPRADWLCGGLRVVDATGTAMGEIRPDLHGNSFAPLLANAWAPLQSAFVRAAAFFAAGGFDPTFGEVTEDDDLARRIALRGEFASTPEPVACLLRGRGWVSSTSWALAAENTKRSRDRVLAERGALRRVLGSTRGAYWSGRVLRASLSTIRWNLAQRRPFAALSRTAFALATAAAAGPGVLSRSYWDGLRAHRPPNTLQPLIEKYERERG